jgi:hypothetical protein
VILCFVRRLGRPFFFAFALYDAPILSSLTAVLLRKRRSATCTDVTGWTPGVDGYGVNQTHSCKYMAAKEAFPDIFPIPPGLFVIEEGWPILTLGARGGVLTQYITNTLQGNGQRT